MTGPITSAGAGGYSQEDKPRERRLIEGEKQWCVGGMQGSGVSIRVSLGRSQLRPQERPQEAVPSVFGLEVLCIR